MSDRPGKYTLAYVKRTRPNGGEVLFAMNELGDGRMVDVETGEILEAGKYGVISLRKTGQVYDDLDGVLKAYYLEVSHD